jgi:radical SAM superfamily enzyme YgiQ (UPF0313 family)
MSVLLITPPFTQLNTPYPATAYLKGFLNTKNIPSFQCDLGIEVLLEIFSKSGLHELFVSADVSDRKSENSKRIFALRTLYVECIDDVVSFLQGNNPTIAYLIASRNFLPEAGRFDNYNDSAFGSMGVQDKARYIATLFLEDLSDFIKECVDENFGFTRYAERLGRCANLFDEIYDALHQAPSFIDSILTDLLKKHIENTSPGLIAVSVPFPGNLFAAFRMAQWVKNNHPDIKIAMGGGFPNTELRSLNDPRVFEFFDFITLDDGEAPIEQIMRYMNDEIAKDDLKRTYLLSDQRVVYINNTSCKDYKQSDTGTPDYRDLLLDKYISAIDVANPMHSLWSNGRWNKLTMAHGCYWGKCTFCDISLDYIQRYEPLTAKILCDRMEDIIAQTGTNGFHFVDEAAPPSLMRLLAIEIIRRKMVVSWWTNIRFEKSFTRDLCLLLKASGCIAVSGGLEVASDRLLELIDKGVTVAQVAKVNRNFTEAGIMVHAYLMYGFPTQTDQETIDSLEMVRQLFKTGVLQSAYWHQFAMTAHSPVGMNPMKFKVKRAKETVISFADNDVEHIDPTGADHDSYSFGLKKSLFNYMQGIGLDEPLHTWFERKVPKTTVDSGHILKIINEDELPAFNPNAKVIFFGTLMDYERFTKSKKGNQWTVMQLSFVSKRETMTIQVDEEKGKWLISVLPKLMMNQNNLLTLGELKNDYENSGLEDFELFWDNKPVSQLYKVGLLRV